MQSGAFQRCWTLPDYAALHPGYLTGYRIDLLVEDQLIVELKAIDKILPIHEAQLLSYLKMSNLKVGLLLNFNVTRLKNGIKRLAN